MIEFSPLFADLEDIIPVVIFIIIAIISVIGNILNKGGQQRPGGRGPRQAGRPQAGGKPAAEQLVDEIGDFLRKAAGQGKKQQPGRAAAEARQPRPAVAAREPGPAQATAVEAQVVEEMPFERDARKRRRERIEKESRARQASQLGSEIAQADKKAAQHAHEVFDHEVSRLAKRSKKKRDELPSTAAAGLAALFANADNIRQAIIINEVLTRPVDRWK